MWDFLKNDNSPLGKYTRTQVQNGNFEILSAENYWNEYGYTLGHLLMVSEIVGMATMFTPGPSGSSAGKGVGYRGITPSKPSAVPTFNEFRAANKGKFSGYPGRGTSTRMAWDAYRAKYGNQVIFK